MKVLITGAHGFIGRHVVAELEHHHELWIPRRSELDLLDENAVDNIVRYCSETLEGSPAIDAIIHLAATCGGIGINKDNPGKFIYENLQMGINILEAARLAGVSKVVNMGTVCAYPKYTRVPFQEEEIWNGYPEETNAPYGIAKKTVMEMGKAYSIQYGMDVTNLVPVNMAGEWDNFDEHSSHVIPALIKKFEDPQYGDWHRDGRDGGMRGQMKDPYVELWGTGLASREFLYAGDCARAIAIALGKNVGSEPINLGTGEEVTIADLAATIKKVGKYKSEIVWDKTKPDGQPRRCLDIGRARRLLEWEPSVGLEETVRRSIDWYRNNG